MVINLGRTPLLFGYLFDLVAPVKGGGGCLRRISSLSRVSDCRLFFGIFALLLGSVCSQPPGGGSAAEAISVALSSGV